MKKIMLLGAFAIITNSSFAQLFVSGGFGFNTSGSKTTSGSVTNDGTKSLTYGITPRIGYFFTKNIVAGIDFTFSGDRLKYANNGGKDVGHGFSAGPFVRYVHKFNEYFGAWGEFRGAVGGEKTKFNDMDKTKNFSTTASLIPGVLVFAGNHLSFEFSYGTFGNSYLRTTDLTSNVDQYTTSNTFGLNLNPSTTRFAVNYTF